MLCDAIWVHCVGKRQELRIFLIFAPSVHARDLVRRFHGMWNGTKELTGGLKALDLEEMLVSQIDPG